MSAFEFFFSFYGLILGLAVVEIMGGFSRVLKSRKLSALKLCTPLLALLVLLDVIQFWVDTWTRHQEPNINAGVLTVALGIAAIFYLAASLVFPDKLEDCDNLDEHYDAHKRKIIGLSITANLLSLTALPILAGQPEVVTRIFATPVVMFVFIWIAPLLLICLIKNRRINVALLVLQCLFYLVTTFWQAIAAL